MAPSPPLAGIGDFLVSSLGAVGVVVAEVVTRMRSGQPLPRRMRDVAHQRAKDSLQNMHEYGFSPESNRKSELAARPCMRALVQRGMATHGGADAS
jgi:hypothetical protein